MLRLSYEKVTINEVSYPVEPDGVSKGNVALYNITPYLKVGNSIVQGSLNYPTVTLTLKGLSYPPPLNPITPQNVSEQTFRFRNIDYILISAVEGGRIQINTTNDILLSWTITGVDGSIIEFSAG